MKQKLLIPLLAIAVSFLAAPGKAHGQDKTPSSRERNPPGNWTIDFRPYAGAGYESMPVQLVSYKGEMERDGRLVISGRHLKNQSDKGVRLISMTIYVYDERNTETPLAERTTFKFGYPPGHFPAGVEIREPTEGVQNFMSMDAVNEDRALLKPLLRDGRLDGNYRIVLAVTRVQFEDGEVWEYKPPTTASVSSR